MKSPLLFQVLRSPPVILRPGIQVMLGAIQLDHQLCVGTVKIHNITAKYFLPSELTGECTKKSVQKTVFFLCGVAAEELRELCILLFDFLRPPSSAPALPGHLPPQGEGLPPSWLPPGGEASSLSWLPLGGKLARASGTDEGTFPAGFSSPPHPPRLCRGAFPHRGTAYLPRGFPWGGRPQHLTAPAGSPAAWRRIPPW